MKDAGDLTRHVGALKPGDKVELTTCATAPRRRRSDARLAEGRKDRDAAGCHASPTPSGSDSNSRLRAGPGAGQRASPWSASNPTASRPQGLATGDVILAVGGNTVTTPQDVKSGIADANQDRKAVLLRVQTAEGSRFVAIELPKA